MGSDYPLMWLVYGDSLLKEGFLQINLKTTFVINIVLRYLVPWNLEICFCNMFVWLIDKNQAHVLVCTIIIWDVLKLVESGLGQEKVTIKVLIKKK
jgi:hypothetical protein